MINEKFSNKLHIIPLYTQSHQIGQAQ